MNKGTDLIQRQQIEIIDGYPTGNVYVGLASEELAELEKELKALEVIKKRVDIGGDIDIRLLKYSKSFEDYDWECYECDRLTKEEYDLLRDVLL